MKSHDEIENQDDAATQRDPGTEDEGRRRFLRTAVAGGAGLAVGVAAGGTAVASATDESSDATRTLSFEVACVGTTERVIIMPWLADIAPPYGDLDPADIRGSLFWIEGWIYEAGTLPPEGFVPTEDGRIGTWFCRGNLLISPDRGEPQVATVQEYHLGDFAKEPLGERLLTSQGVEGRDAPGWEAYRVVTGGTGEYRGARGQVVQTMIGTNATPSGPEGAPTANFRFDFDIDLPRSTGTSPTSGGG